MGWEYDSREAVQVLPEGDYDAELTGVEDTTSKAGNQMRVVTWAVTRPDRVHRILEYIVRPSGIWKYKLIAEALGEHRAFENNAFDLAEHVGKFCLVTLSIQKQQNYPEKNVIESYASASFEPGNEPIPAAIAEQNSDATIPF